MPSVTGLLIKMPSAKFHRKTEDMKILFLRHGITEWNIQKKLQGRADILLSDTGEAQVSSWVIPEGVVQWYVSPLKRAQHTAALLGIKDYEDCPELIEMSWGCWEGKTLEILRAENEVAMTEIEARGLDMRPPGGESPREVRQRVHHWLKSLSPNNYVGAITHKGVIRAALSLATGWDMKSSHSVKVRNDLGYLFRWKSGNLVYEKEQKLCR